MVPYSYTAMIVSDASNVPNDTGEYTTWAYVVDPRACSRLPRLSDVVDVDSQGCSAPSGGQARPGIRRNRHSEPLQPHDLNIYIYISTIYLCIYIYTHIHPFTQPELHPRRFGRSGGCRNSKATFGTCRAPQR